MQDAMSTHRTYAQMDNYFHKYPAEYLTNLHQKRVTQLQSIRACISHFKDCPLCGARIEGIEPDAKLEALVDRFIDAHARIKRSKNVEAAVRPWDLGDVPVPITYNKESVKFLSMPPTKDLEFLFRLSAVVDNIKISHNSSFTFICSWFVLSVSLNISELHYYNGNLQSARNYYIHPLDVRKNVVASQVNCGLNSWVTWDRNAVVLDCIGFGTYALAHDGNNSIKRLIHMITKNWLDAC